LIFICNSDDYWDSNRAVIFDRHFYNNKSDYYFAFGAVIPVDEDGNESKNFQHALLCSYKKSLYFNSEKYDLLSRNVAISTGNLVFNKSLATKIGGFNSSLKYCIDWEFALKATLYSNTYYLDNAIYFYRLHSTNSFLSLSEVAHTESNLVMSNYNNEKSHLLFNHESMWINNFY